MPRIDQRDTAVREVPKARALSALRRVDSQSLSELVVEIERFDSSGRKNSSASGECCSCIHIAAYGGSKLPPRQKNAKHAEAHCFLSYLFGRR